MLDEEDLKVLAIAQSVQVETEIVYLRTAVAEVQRQKKAWDEVFLDHGAQVSLLTRAPAVALEALQVGKSKVD